MVQGINLALGSHDCASSFSSQNVPYTSATSWKPRFCALSMLLISACPIHAFTLRTLGLDLVMWLSRIWLRWEPLLVVSAALIAK